MHGSYLQDWLLNPKATSWRVDPKAGGPSRAFGDIGSHWCDLVEWVTGDRIARLVATTSITIKQRPAASAATFSAAESDAPLVDVETEDSALILFRTANDIAGSAVISQLSAGRKNRLWIEVDGMHQSAVFDQESAEHLWIGHEAGSQLLVRDPNQGSAEQRRLSMLPAGHAQGYAQCFENYVAASYAAVDAHAGNLHSRSRRWGPRPFRDRWQRPVLGPTGGSGIAGAERISHHDRRVRRLHRRESSRGPDQGPASNHQRSGKPGNRSGGVQHCDPDHRQGDPAGDDG